MPNFSFDIVSEINLSEINNVFDQTKREIANRYDFKGTPADIIWIDDKKSLKLIGNSDFQIDAIIEIIRKKLATRGMSQKILDESKEVEVSNLLTSKIVPLKAGINSETAKQISKSIRDVFPKSKPLIIGESIRVSSSSKNELQEIITKLTKDDLDIPLQFTNYR